MYVCYIDESGTSDIPGTSSHFVLAGISIPIWHWRDADREVERILANVALGEAELHTAWVLLPYPEQLRIPNFSGLGYSARRSAVERERAAELLRLQKQKNPKAYKQQKKTYAHTWPYVHLTLEERRALVSRVAACVGNWGFARLFAKCIDKLHFDPARTGRPIDEQAFEQVVTRFQMYLRNTQDEGDKNLDILVHDNNATVSRKHTKLMRLFHRQGTLWTSVKNIVETPLFVDSSLTRMVQIADLCSYALRRYVENGESALLEKIMPRADRSKNKIVGIRHYTKMSCSCVLCESH